MPKQIMIVLSLFGFVSVVFCADVSKDASTATAAPLQSQPASYTIIKGDTLWGIAGRHYNDPWAWQKLWSANKNTVNNPNLIYPNQVLTIPDKSQLKDIPGDSANIPVQPESEAKPPEEASVPAVAGEETAQTITGEAPTLIDTVTIKEEENAEPETAEVTNSQSEAKLPGFDHDPAVTEPSAPIEKNELAQSKYFGSESMIVSKDWASDGVIADGKEKKLMISEGDAVYVNLGSDKVKGGTQCIIYRKTGKVKENGSVLGYGVRRVGKLEIGEDVGENVSSAKIIISYEPIQKGDAVEIITPGK